MREFCSVEVALCSDKSYQQGRTEGERGGGRWTYVSLAKSMHTLTRVRPCTGNWSGGRAIRPDGSASSSRDPTPANNPIFGRSHHVALPIYPTPIGQRRQVQRCPSTHIHTSEPRGRTHLLFEQSLIHPPSSTLLRLSNVHSSSPSTSSILTNDVSQTSNLSSTPFGCPPKCDYPLDEREPVVKILRVSYQRGGVQVGV